MNCVFRRQNSSAQKIVEFLEAHDEAPAVNYPEPASNRQYEIAARQMRGLTGMLTPSIGDDLIADLDGALESM